MHLLQQPLFCTHLDCPSLPSPGSRLQPALLLALKHTQHISVSFPLTQRRIQNWDCHENKFTILNSVFIFIYGVTYTSLSDLPFFQYENGCKSNSFCCTIALLLEMPSIASVNDFTILCWELNFIATQCVYIKTNFWNTEVVTEFETHQWHGDRRTCIILQLSVSIE